MTEDFADVRRWNANTIGNHEPVERHESDGHRALPMSIYATLWTLTGEAYAHMTFDDLHQRICDALRGNRSPVVAEVFLPDGTHRIIRAKKKHSDASGKSQADPGSA